MGWDYDKRWTAAHKQLFNMTPFTGVKVVLPVEQLGGQANYSWFMVEDGKEVTLIKLLKHFITPKVSARGR